MGNKVLLTFTCYFDNMFLKIKGGEKMKTLIVVLLISILSYFTTSAGWAKDVVEREYDYAIVVEKGDSLWKIAQTYCGDGSLWFEVAKYNEIKNPKLIYPGQEILIPGEIYAGPLID